MGKRLKDVADALRCSMNTTQIESLCTVNAENLGGGTSPDYEFGYIDISAVLSQRVDPSQVQRLQTAFLLLVLEPRDEEVRRRTVKTGTTVESIDWAAFRRIPVSWPEEGEREAILRIADALDRNTAVHVAENAKLIQLKSGLMDNLLSGTVPVPADLHPEEMPA